MYRTNETRRGQTYVGIATLRETRDERKSKLKERLGVIDSTERGVNVLGITCRMFRGLSIVMQQTEKVEAENEIERILRRC